MHNFKRADGGEGAQYNGWGRGKFPGGTSKSDRYEMEGSQAQIRGKEKPGQLKIPMHNSKSKEWAEMT